MSDASAFTLMTWNVNSKKPDAERVVRQIREWSPDVILLQELDDRHVERLESIGEFRLVTARDYRRGEDLNHLGVLSRLPILGAEPIAQNEDGAVTRSLVGRIKNVAECLESLKVRVRCGDREVTLVSAHFAASGPPSRRLAELGRALDGCGDAPLALIGGDFNTYAKPLLNPLIGWGLGFGWADLAINENDAVERLARSHGMDCFIGEITAPTIRHQLDQVVARGLAVDRVRIADNQRESDHKAILLDCRIPATAAGAVKAAVA